MDPRKRDSFLLLSFLILFLFSFSPRASAKDRPERWVGLSLEQALQALQAEGLNVLFSSEVVRPEMQVAAEPRSRKPRQVLDEVLAPNGLEARRGPGGAWLVVPGVPVGNIRGVAQDRNGKPLAGVRVEIPGTRLQDVTGADGRFEIRGL